MNLDNHEDFDKRIGKRIEEVRTRKNMTLFDVSSRLDSQLTEQMLAQYESGESSLPLWLVPQLANALGVSSGLLFEDNVNAKNSKNLRIEKNCDCARKMPLAVLGVEEVQSIRPDLNKLEATSVLIHAWKHYTISPNVTRGELGACAFYLYGEPSET